MYRTHNLGELRIENVNQEVELSGWVQKIRNLDKNRHHYLSMMKYP